MLGVEFGEPREPSGNVLRHFVCATGPSPHEAVIEAEHSREAAL
jgi:hypothetical protein